MTSKKQARGSVPRPLSHPGWFAGDGRYAAVPGVSVADRSTGFNQ